MNPDYAQLAKQAVEFLKPFLVAAGGKVVEQGLGKAGQGAAKFFGWLRSKFTKPAAAGALEKTVQAPFQAENWEALRLQILEALKEDEAFRKEFEEVFQAAGGLTVSQSAVTSGSSNVTAQIAGTNNQINIGR